MLCACSGGANSAGGAGSASPRSEKGTSFGAFGSMACNPARSLDDKCLFWFHEEKNKRPGVPSWTIWLLPEIFSPSARITGEEARPKRPSRQVCLQRPTLALREARDQGGDMPNRRAKAAISGIFRLVIVIPPENQAR